MHIEHVALWTADLERLRAFYCEVLGATASAPYCNPRTGFGSYFLSFGHGARLEIMSRPDVGERPSRTPLGYAHLALRVGDRGVVDRLTEDLRARGVPVVSGPRVTGDGYYESVIEDPDGNLIEICA